MADAMRGACSMTPVVTNVGIGNSADVDVLHDDIKATLGGKMTVEATAKYFDTVTEINNDGPKWYYCPDLKVTATSTNFYDFTGVSASPANNNVAGATADYYSNVDQFTNTIHDTSDSVYMFYAENTGLDDTGAATTNILGVSTAGGSVGGSTIMLEPGESVLLKFSWRALMTNLATMDPGTLHLDCCSSVGAAPAAPDHVLAKVVAFMEDGYADN